MNALWAKQQPKRRGKIIGCVVAVACVAAAATSHSLSRNISAKKRNEISRSSDFGSSIVISSGLWSQTSIIFPYLASLTASSKSRRLEAIKMFDGASWCHFIFRLLKKKRIMTHRQVKNNFSMDILSKSFRSCSQYCGHSLFWSLRTLRFAWHFALFVAGVILIKIALHWECPYTDCSFLCVATTK